MKKTYTKPEFNKNSFVLKDIVTTSALYSKFNIKAIHSDDGINWYDVNGF